MPPKKNNPKTVKNKLLKAKKNVESERSGASSATASASASQTVKFGSSPCKIARRTANSARMDRLGTMTLPKQKTCDTLSKYSLEELRRVIEKQIHLGILDSESIEMFLEGDADPAEEKILCLHNKNLKWNSFEIKGQTFELPEFIRHPVYLASGGFGTVIKALRYGRPVAVKKVSVPEKRDWEMALRLLREIVIMKQAKKVGQRHISKILDIFGNRDAKTPEELESLYIVMPLYDPGSVENFNVDTLEQFKTIAGHTINALRFLHKHQILHRDIKKENIFYNEENDRAYLADLGQARQIGHRMSGRGEVGTRCYLSPEILQGNEYDYRSDVYSLGCTLFEMMVLKGTKSLYPYGKSGGSDHILMQKAISGYARVKRHGGFLTDEELEYEEFAEDRWEALYKKAEEWKAENLVRIIESMMQFDPKDRVDCDNLMEDPFFQDFKTEFEPVCLKTVDLNDYNVIKQRIFDLQHGSCNHGAQGKDLRKMCSRAVGYFEKQ